jgi:hypothetical protein
MPLESWQIQTINDGVEMPQPATSLYSRCQTSATSRSALGTVIEVPRDRIVKMLQEVEGWSFLRPSSSEERFNLVEAIAEFHDDQHDPLANYSSYKHRNYCFQPSAGLSETCLLCDKRLMPISGYSAVWVLRKDLPSLALQCNAHTDFDEKEVLPGFQTVNCKKLQVCDLSKLGE